MGAFGELSAKAMALPAKDRAELAELLIKSLEEQDNEEIKSAWLAEVYRRDHCGVEDVAKHDSFL